MTELKHTLEEEDQTNTECCDSGCGLIYVVNITSLMVASSLAQTTHYKMPPEEQLDNKRSLNSLKIK